MPEQQKWVVTRQNYWGVEVDDANVVEIAFGGMDYAGADALSAEYPGEFAEFTDPREAAKTALEIQKLWQTAEPNKKINIAQGATGGMTLPFEPDTVDAITAWADTRWEALDKCEMCGDVLPAEAYFDVFGEPTLCSEFCADKQHEQVEEGPEEG